MYLVGDGDPISGMTSLRRAWLLHAVKWFDSHSHKSPPMFIFFIRTLEAAIGCGAAQNNE